MEKFRLTAIGVGIFFSTLILYLLTAYPTVAYIDSGELAVVNWTLGIAHPTGYPLYTLVGRLFSLLPLELITTQILLGALCTATAAALMAVRLMRLMKAETPVRQTGVALTGMLLGVAPLMWSQGVTNEVYSLHILMVVLIVTFLLQPYSPRRLALGAFIVGLSFGNHMSTVLLLPAVGYYLIIHRRAIGAAPRQLLLAIGFAVAAATLYLYLPIRSALDPIFNWGEPTNWGNFVRHVSGWQYQVWMFSRTTDELINSLGNFAVILYRQFPLPYWPMILYGIVTAWRKQRQMAVLLTLILAVNLLYSLNFSIPDIDNYLLPSVLVLIVFSAVGVGTLTRNWKKYELLIAAFVGAMMIWGIAVNWRANDQSDNYSALDGVHNFYGSVEGNALVFCSEWDVVSPWLYSHFYLQERPDVVLVDNELVRRSWYPAWIRHADERLYDSIRAEVGAFLPQVRKFERGEAYDGRIIEAAYQKLLAKMVNYRGREFYYDQTVQLSFPPPGETIIRGQLVRVKRENESYSELDSTLPPPRFGKPESELTEREQRHLRGYSLMLELARKQAEQPSQP